MSLKPICVKCQRFFRPWRNGVWFVEAMPKYNGAPPGNVAPADWQPYKLWRGDEYRCYGCGTVIISGAGQLPVRERHHPDFKTVVEAVKPVVQVNDC